jgi:hypothetical protein
MILVDVSRAVMLPGEKWILTTATVAYPLSCHMGFPELSAGYLLTGGI